VVRFHDPSRLVPKSPQDYIQPNGKFVTGPDGQTKFMPKHMPTKDQARKFLQTRLDSGALAVKPGKDFGRENLWQIEYPMQGAAKALKDNARQIEKLETKAAEDGIQIAKDGYQIGNLKAKGVADESKIAKLEAENRRVAKENAASKAKITKLEKKEAADEATIKELKKRVESGEKLTRDILVHDVERDANFKKSYADFMEASENLIKAYKEVADERKDNGGVESKVAASGLTSAALIYQQKLEQAAIDAGQEFSLEFAKGKATEDLKNLLKQAGIQGWVEEVETTTPSPGLIETLTGKGPSKKSSTRSLNHETRIEKPGWIARLGNYFRSQPTEAR